MKTAVITGATSGIGFETAKALLEKGYFVIGIGRSEENIGKALKSLDNNNIKFIKADLSSQQDIGRLADEAREMLPDGRLDVLINNAGSFYSYYCLSGEGVEMQFAVNAVAPLYLSVLLYDNLKRGGGRIITVGSGSHYRTLVNWQDLQLCKNYGQLRAYKQTKLFSVMLAREFNRRSKGVKAYIADPGLVNTEMGFKNTKGLARLVWKLRKEHGQAPAKGAETVIYLASEQRLEDRLYWKDRRPKKEARNSMSVENSKKIWQYCCRLCSLNPDSVLEE